MCGIIGVYSHSSPVATEIYDGLIHLQHRGQDATGIVTYDERFHLVKGSGLIRDVFDEKNMTRLTGSWGLGHTRYATNGRTYSVEDAQPFLLSSPYGLAMIHNGDLTNYQSLKKELLEKDQRHCNSTSDLEVIMHVFAAKLAQLPASPDFFENICQAVSSVFARTQGAYAVIGVIAGKGMFAFRDPHGIRPLVYGTRKDASGRSEYIFSSENTMYYPLGFKLIDDIRAGEVVYIDENSLLHRRLLAAQSFRPCVFEYVYFARPDSLMNNVSVYRARLRMGQNLARRWQEKYGDLRPDIVIPIPFSSNTAALSIAHELGVRYSEGLYKNSFIGRTFIMPGQQQRRQSVLRKLSPQEIEIRDKRVMLVDDSIVRGTTSAEVVKLVRDAGAREVFFVSTCPPVISPCFYGVDMPTTEELIAATKSVEEIRVAINADILFYQNISDLVEAVTRKGDHHIDRPCLACLDKMYVTSDISAQHLEVLSQEKKQIRQKSAA